MKSRSDCKISPSRHEKIDNEEGFISHISHNAFTQPISGLKCIIGLLLRPACGEVYCECIMCWRGNKLAKVIPKII